MIEVGLTTDGDWNITQDGTMTVVGGIDYILQKIWVLLRTVPGDYIYNSVNGFDMSKYLSLPNIQSTIDLLKADMHRAIMNIPNIAGHDVLIDAFPTAMDQVKLTIDILSPEGDSVRLNTNLSFSAAAKECFGFSIVNHTPYSTGTSKPILELVTISESSTTLELAHQPINSFVQVYDHPENLELSGNTVLGSSLIELSLHVTTPLTLQYDLSGNPFSGNQIASEFIADTNASGDFILYSVVNDTFRECTIVDSNPSLSNYIFTNNPAYASITFSGNIVAETPDDLTVQKATIQSIYNVNDFDLNLQYTTALAIANSTSSTVMELNKSSISYSGRSSYRWFATFPVLLLPGTYAVVYNTFDYR